MTQHWCLRLQVHRLDNAICIHVKTRKPRKRAPARGRQPHGAPGAEAPGGPRATQLDSGGEAASSAQRSADGRAAGAHDTEAAAAIGGKCVAAGGAHQCRAVGPDRIEQFILSGGVLYNY